MNGKRAKLLRRQAEANSPERSGYKIIKHAQRIWDVGAKKWRNHWKHTTICTGMRADYKRLKKEYNAGVAQG